MDRSEITHLIDQLHSTDAHERKTAAELLSTLPQPPPGIFDAVRSLAETDPNSYVKAAARQALEAWGPGALAPAANSPVTDSPSLESLLTDLLRIARVQADYLNAIRDHTRLMYFLIAAFAFLTLVSFLISLF